MNRIDLLKEFEDSLYHDLLSYSESNLMNKPKERFVKEWKETKTKIKLLGGLIEQQEELGGIDIFYMVKDERSEIIKSFFWLNQAINYADKKKEEYIKNCDNTRVWVEKNGDTEIIYEAKGKTKQEVAEEELE